MNTTRKRLNRTFCFLAVAVATVTGGTLWADSFTWNTGTNGAWNLPANWDGSNPFTFPVTGDDATQDDSFKSRILIDSDEACLNFTGDGDSGLDRFMRVCSGMTLTCGTDFVKTTGTTNYGVRVEDGSSGDETTLDVGGDVTGVNITRTKGDVGDWVKIDVDGDANDLGITLRDNITIIVDGDLIGVGTGTAATKWKVEDDSTITVLGDVDSMNLTLGTSSATSGDVTTMTVGSIGDLGASHETIDLSGYAKLFVDDSGTGSGDYFARNETEAKVLQRDNSEMDVDGVTTKALWELEDNSIFRGHGNIVEGIWNLHDTSLVEHDGTKTQDGVWTLKNSSIVKAHGIIEEGVWNLNDTSLVEHDGVESQGGVWSLNDTSLANFVGAEAKGGVWTINGDARFVSTDDATILNAVSDWTVNSNGTVANPWGVDMVSGGTQKFYPSVLTVQNGTVRADHIGYIAGETDPEWDTFFKGDSVVEANKRSWWRGSGSDVSYEGINNLFRHKGINNGVGFDGAFLRVGSAELEIEINKGASGYLTIDSQLTSIDGNGQLDILEFQVQGVTVTIQGGGPNNGALEAVGPDYDGEWLDVSGSPVRPFFDDVPCTKRWAEVRVLSGSAAMFDQNINSVISGFDGTTSQYVRDAVYAFDLYVATGATLITGVPSVQNQELVRVYTTNAAVISGSVNCTGGGSCASEVIKLDCVTSYGNFNCVTTSSDDQVDVGFFNDAWDTVMDVDAAYNALVDFNCDGEIDCADRDQFLCNWPSATGVSDYAGGAACGTPTCP